MKINQDELQKYRHEMGYYSIKEICVMFGCNRTRIDNAINTKELDYISPNGRTRFVKLNEFLEYCNRK